MRIVFLVVAVFLLFFPSVQIEMTPPTAEQVRGFVEETGLGTYQASDLIVEGEVIATQEEVFFEQEEIDQMTEAQKREIQLTDPPLVVDQYGGTQEYHCDLGEAAFGNWYVSQRGVLVVHWHLRNWTTGRIVVAPRTVPAPTAGQFMVWIQPKPFASLIRAVWSYLYPSWFADGSCVI